jgi:hypothetical protein
MMSAVGAGVPQTVRAGRQSLREVEGEEGAIVLIIAKYDIQIDDRLVVLEPVR